MHLLLPGSPHPAILLLGALLAIAPDARAAAPLSPQNAPRRGAATQPRRAASTERGAARALRAALVAAAAEREPIEEHALRLESAGQLAEAAASLATGAVIYGDPLLHLAAADLWLKLGEMRGGAVEDKHALDHARIAQQLLAAPVNRSRVDPGDHATFAARADTLITRARHHQAAMVARRDDRAQLIAGSLLAGAGVVGLGVMTRGLQLERISSSELEKGAGRPDADLEPLRRQAQRGETMIAAGAVSGAIGLALGLALAAFGARAIRRPRLDQNRPHVTIAPGLHGLTFAGRF